MPARRLIGIAHGLTSIGYVAWIQHGIRKHADAMFRQRGKQTAKSAIIFLLTLLGLSPILKTLTEDISTDTVWSMALWCLVANIVFFDYAQQ